VCVGENIGFDTFKFLEETLIVLLRQHLPRHRKEQVLLLPDVCWIELSDVAKYF
jgi:hypothetical protein